MSFSRSLVLHSGVDCEYWCHPLSALCLRVQADVFTQPNAARKDLGAVWQEAKARGVSEER